MWGGGAAKTAVDLDVNSFDQSVFSSFLCLSGILSGSWNYYFSLPLFLLSEF